MDPEQLIGARRLDDTIVSFGHGDNWHSTWAADGTLLTAMCDGWGLPGAPRDYRNSRLFRLLGGPPDLRFEAVEGYPALRLDVLNELDVYDRRTRYYGFGTLSVGGVLHQFLSTFAPLTPEDPRLRFVGAKLIVSPDGGATWCNQDGTTPVRWEDWAEQSSDTMAFFHEPGEAFSLPSVLQMGRDYADNADGYVYVYAPNGNLEGTMNQLVLARVPVDRVVDRSAYRFFADRTPDGGAVWTEDIRGRGVVHTFPSGHVNADPRAHPYAWQPSVTYVRALGLYLMANWGEGVGDDGRWFGRPSCLGFWAARHPWGPWRPFHEEPSWTPGGDLDARCYQPQILPSFVAEDGRSFWLAWTEFRPPRESAELAERELRIRSAGDVEAFYDLLRDRLPHYSLNLQRVDLTMDPGS